MGKASAENWRAKYYRMDAWIAWTVDTAPQWHHQNFKGGAKARII